MTDFWKNIFGTIIGAIIIAALLGIYNKVDQVPVLAEKINGIEKDMEGVKKDIRSIERTVRITKEDDKVVRLIEEE